MFQHIVNKYFGGELQSGFVTLFVSKSLIHGLAVALATIFLPIFIYVSSGNNILTVLLFYFVGFLAYAFLVAFGAQFLNTFGFRRALFTSSILDALFFILLYFVTTENFITILVILIILNINVKLLFWLPYHVDFAIFTEFKRRGREVSIVLATAGFLGIIGPILAGYIINFSGYGVLFAIVAVLLVIAAFSYLLLPRTNEKFSWTYKETWQQFLSPKYRHEMIALSAQGAESILAIIIWPIFIYILLSGNVLFVGLVSTLIFGLSLAIQLFLGKYIDMSQVHKYKTLRIGSILYALGWIFKIFVLSAFQILIVGMYHNLVKIFTQTSFQTLIYDLAADEGHYVDEFTVIREMAINFGKSAGIILIGIIAVIFGIQWSFIIGAVAALLLNILYLGKLQDSK